jgi:hypothetical protein
MSEPQYKIPQGLVNAMIQYLSNLSVPKVTVNEVQAMIQRLVTLEAIEESKPEKAPRILPDESTAS